MSFRVIAVAAVITLLAGCASTPSPKGNNINKLSKERIQFLETQQPIVKLLKAVRARAESDQYTHLPPSATPDDEQQPHQKQDTYQWTPVKSTRLAAERGDKQSQYLLGLFYLRGKGVTRNTTKAATWILKAAKNDYLPAQARIASMYYKGIEVDKNIRRAMLWFSQAAQAGRIHAQVMVANILSSGKGETKQSYDRAIYWYTQAAQQGSAQAQYNLAVMFYQGLGTQRDYNKAAKWFHRAAQAGYAKAMYNLALMFQLGRGVSVNKHKAFKLYKRALANGALRARADLALMYYHGVGTKQNKMRAISLLQGAINDGSQRAERLMKQILNIKTTEKISNKRPKQTGSPSVPLRP